jgi:hypothetical protein
MSQYILLLELLTLEDHTKISTVVRKDFSKAYVLVKKLDVYNESLRDRKLNLITNKKN